MSNESILVILLVGLIAGWLAGKIVSGTGYGFVADICIGNDVDEPVKRMQAPEEIIVFPIGARQECGEIAESDALQALDSIKSGKRAGVLRADPIDQNLVELTHLASTSHREGQHVPERKAKTIDKYLPACLRMPLGRIERSQEIVDFTSARIEVGLDGELLDQ